MLFYTFRSGIFHYNLSDEEKMSWLDDESRLFLNVFKRLPLEIQKGEGCYLFDRSGNKYLDFLSGLGVNALGYSHPVILRAIQTQLSRNLHLSNFFVQDVQIALAKKLLQMSGYDRVFFTNSGTESIEGILKLVKKYGNLNKKNQVITFQNAFHGRSLGALSITAQKKYQTFFQPLLPHIIDLPFNDPQSLKKTIGPQTVAIFLEFIQGEGGVIPVLPEIVDILSEAQRKYQLLVVADEIQTGIGRTGKFYAFQHYNIQPDIVAVAKAIGGGLPLGAFLIKESLNNILVRGEHGTTFGGNPAACAAGLATLNLFEQRDLLKHVELLGSYFSRELGRLKELYPVLIRDYRGIGFMQGMELTREASPVILEGLKKGIILNSTAGNVLRFLPPLIIEKKQIDQGLQILQEIFFEIQKQKN
jgi:acetylornithine/N-succinyldiaminopimelate aminotransferase